MALASHPAALLVCCCYDYTARRLIFARIIEFGGIAMRAKCVLLALVALLPLPGGLRAQKIKLPKKLAELQTEVRADSNDAVLHYNVALGYWIEKKYDDAERELTQATTLDPRLAIAYLARAYLPFARRPQLWGEVVDHRAQPEFRKALQASDQDYRQAFMIDPLVDLRITAAVAPKKSAFWAADEELAQIYNDWLQGFDDFREGNYSAALLRFDRMVREFREGKTQLSRIPGGLLWFRSLAAAHIGRFDEATRDMQELLYRGAHVEHRDSIVYAPMRANEYRFVLATYMMQSGRDAEAKTLYREALQNDVGLYMAHVRLAAILEAEGKLVEAADERQRAVETNPDDATLLIDLAITQAKAGKVAGAQASLEEAARRLPRDSRPHYLLGLINQQSNRLAEAKQEFLRFIELAPHRLERQVSDARRRLATLP
jgi:Tfp pilus assembly protein PilF